MGIAKVTLNNETLMDITDDTVTASGLMLGDTAHGANGESVTGTYEPVTYDVATETTDGLMSASDKVKLNGVATGAEVNQNAFSNVKVGTTTIAADSKTDTLTLTAGTNITLTPNATSDSVTIAVNGMPSKVSDLDNDSGFITSSGTASNVSGTVAIEHGGTGATSASAARTNLGLGSAATASTSSTVGNNSSLPTGAAIQSYVTGLGYTSNTGTVTSVATGAGLTGGTITGSGTIKADLKSETKSSLTSASKGSTSDREYAVGLDANGDLSVNVPWENTQTITGVKGSSESSYRTGNVSISASNIGLGNVENKSSATIRGELTSQNVIDALGYTPGSSGGTVTKVTAGTGLSGGDITTEGTIALKGQNIYYATCPTAATAAAKVATTTNGDFELTTGAMVRVKFTYANTYNGTATLNVDSKGAKNIATVGTTTTSRYFWNAGEVVDFVYDGTRFVMSDQGTATTTYYGITKLEDSTSSTSTTTAATPNSVKAAYDLANAAAPQSTTYTKTEVENYVTGLGYTTNTGTVTSVATGTGLTGGPITTTGTISLEGGVVTAGSAGPTAAVTGDEGNTVAIPRITVDEYGRVTGLTSYNLTNKNTTYTAATTAPGNVASSSSVGTSSNYARQDHTHGIALATGDSNGQVKIAGTNVSVKGWNTAATYDVESTLANDFKLPTGAAVKSFVEGKGYITTDTNTLPSAQCETAADTAAKVATITNYTLTANTYLHFNIRYANTVSGAITMNVNSKGDKPIYINGAASSSSNHTLPAGSYIAFYNGTYWDFRTDGKLPANIFGDATTVNGHTVAINVPSNAVFTDTTALTSMTGILPLANGGTNASTATDARTNLGLGTIATYNVETEVANDTGIPTGSAVTALKNSLTVDGVSFKDSTSVIHYGESTTAAGTAAKTAAVTNFTKIDGAVVYIRFAYANTATAPTLNINNTGAANIRYRNANISSTYIVANEVYCFVYYGGYYQLVGDVDTEATTAQIQTAVDTWLNQHTSSSTIVYSSSVTHTVVTTTDDIIW